MRGAVGPATAGIPATRFAGTRRGLWIPAVAGMTVLFSACSDIVGSGDDDELEDRRRQWALQNIRDYQFEYTRMCFCALGGERVRIEVRNDAVVAVTSVRTGQSLLNTPNGNWPTVDGLFDAVQRAIDTDAHKLDVDYDAQLGYPTKIDIDHIKNAIDDEVVHTATGLVRRP